MCQHCMTHWYNLISTNYFILIVFLAKWCSFDHKFKHTINNFWILFFFYLELFLE